MKKVGKDMSVKYAKWSAIWAILLVFSFFTLSGIVSAHGTDNTESAGVNLETQNETIKDMGIQTNIVENEENEQRSSDKTDEQVKIIADSETETVRSKDTGNHIKIDNNQENKQGSSDGTKEQVKNKDNSETETVRSKDNSETEAVRSKDTGSQIDIDNNQENEKGSNDGTKEQVKTKRSFEKTLISTNCLYNLCEQPAKKWCLSKLSEDSSKMETVIDKGTSGKLETTTSEYYNITTPGSEELKNEIDSGLINWIKMKIILANHPGSINSFYTTSDKVEFQYKNPESLMKNKKVNIYFVVKQNLSFPEKTDTGIIDENNISFEDVLNKDTKSYVQIPVKLNENGALLEPLIFGPLPAGSYWILVTPIGNGTASSGSEEKILSASYFKVLKFEMDTETPDNIREGDNFEVNMKLNNSSAQENYTYWAALIKENPPGANVTANSSIVAKDGIKTFKKGLDIIQNFGLNATNSDFSLSKKELQSEINTLVGVGNGTINIGKENQSTLVLSSLDLPPGKYHLFAGAYEKGNGFVGMDQKEMTIVSHDEKSSK